VRLALRPPRSSVLPPGAGNKAEKAIQPDKERAKKIEERYPSRRELVHRRHDAATVTRHGDGDGAAIVSVEEGQRMLRWGRRTLGVRAV